MAFLATKPGIYYPESDGLPVADNTVQFRAITTLQENIDALFANDPDVFVAGDLLWYPVEGDNKTRQAPDVMVAFGRPKGDRGSYKQWVEGGIAPQVVFEVLSPGNRAGEMQHKLEFYKRYGVEEYYIYDPDRFDFSGYLSSGDGAFQPIEQVNEWISPRLGIRFEISEGQELQVYYPNGERFLSFLELSELKDAEQLGRLIAERERDQAEQARNQAEQEREIAERERDEALERAERLAARLRELGINPED